MKFAFALVALSTLALAPAANAADARLTDCVQMAKQVSAALEAAQPGTSTDQARQQATAGRSYCGSQMYSAGVAHYSKALQLLGKN
ncbi:hypothetical protein [Rhizomicrobium electricum]|jgi:hypothetical protein|uniref:Uncharacterized protein n=1 Tax=Rhizomicrobium electricum TaxID=480070 RepID=A0ABN1F483_9PROT|nr:hypothetical protein [Rhizomicrobium electricum]NIJ49374.1 hypothetical protein [Rhizomicrobium electricum]